MHKETIGRTVFTFKLADNSKQLMDELYQLRYQVYCKECRFIREEDYPDGIETDKFDPFSIHFVTEDSTGVIGTARLILDNPYGFPLENKCGDSLRYDLSRIDRRRVAEISRLAISKTYRRRKNDGLYYTADYQEVKKQEDERASEMKRIKPMAFGLYREIYQECRRRGITHLLALMEKTLWLLLRIHKFDFEQIGDAIHFYGPVAPYICEIKNAEEKLRTQSPELYRYLRDGIEKGADSNAA